MDSRGVAVVVFLLVASVAQTYAQYYPDGAYPGYSPPTVPGVYSPPGVYTPPGAYSPPPALAPNGTSNGTTPPSQSRDFSAAGFSAAGSMFLTVALCFSALFQLL